MNPAQTTGVLQTAPGAYAMMPDPLHAESSLESAVLDKTVVTPTELRALRHLAASNFANVWGTDDLSDTLKVVNNLRNQLQSAITKRNATPEPEAILARWKTETGVDPVKFFTLTLVFAAGLSGKRLPLANAREHALVLLRPDLFYREKVLCQPDSTPVRKKNPVTTLLARKMRKERQSLTKRLKDLIAKPPSGLAPIFAQIRKDWEADMEATRLEFGVALTPEKFREIITTLSKAHRTPAPISAASGMAVSAAG